MAALAASTLVREGADVVVASRSADRADRLAGIVGGRAIELSRLSRALVDVDVVVSCTGAAEVVLSADMVEAAVRERGGRPLRVLDVALPRDVDLAVHALPGVVAADLATLAGRHDLAAAAEDVAAVRAIVADELAAFAGARRQAQVAPTVVALRAMADDVVASELAGWAAACPISTRERSRRSPRRCAGSSTSCCTRRQCGSRSLPQNRRRVLRVCLARAVRARPPRGGSCRPAHRRAGRR